MGRYATMVGRGSVVFCLALTVGLGVVLGATGHESSSSRQILMEARTEASLGADLSATEEGLKPNTPQSPPAPTSAPTLPKVFDEQLTQEGQEVLGYERSLDKAEELYKVEKSRRGKRRLLRELDGWRKLFIEACKTFLHFEREQTRPSPHGLYNRTAVPGNRVGVLCTDRMPIEQQKRDATAAAHKDKTKSRRLQKPLPKPTVHATTSTTTNSTGGNKTTYVESDVQLLDSMLRTI